MSTIFCPKCGFKNLQDSQYCQSCGGPLPTTTQREDKPSPLNPVVKRHVDPAPIQISPKTLRIVIWVASIIVGLLMISWIEQHMSFTARLFYQTFIFTLIIWIFISVSPFLFLLIPKATIGENLHSGVFSVLNVKANVGQVLNDLELQLKDQLKPEEPSTGIFLRRERLREKYVLVKKGLHLDVITIEKDTSSGITLIHIYVTTGMDNLSVSWSGHYLGDFSWFRLILLWPVALMHLWILAIGVPLISLMTSNVQSSDPSLDRKLRPLPSIGDVLLVFRLPRTEFDNEEILALEGVVNHTLKRYVASLAV